MVNKNNLLVALLGIMIAGVGFGLVTPVTVILLEKNHTQGWLTGLVTMVGYLAIFFCSGFAGKLYSKYNLKKLLLFGLFLWMFGALGHIFWFNLYILFPVKLIMGMGGTFVFIGTEVLINYTSTNQNRGKNIGLYASLLSAGIAVGTLLIWTVKIADYVPFLIGAAIMVIVIIFISFLLEDIHLNTKNSIQERLQFSQMPKTGIFSALIYGLFESSIIVVVPLFGLRIGLDQNQVAYVLASFVIGGIVLLYYISRLSDKYSKYNIILIVSFLLAIFLLVPIASSDFYVLLILFFIIGGIIPSFYTIGLGYTVEYVDSKYIAYSNSFFIMMYGFGTLVGPLWGSLLVDYSLNIGYWLYSALLCLSFFVYFSINKAKYQKK